MKDKKPRVHPMSLLKLNLGIPDEPDTDPPPTERDNAIPAHVITSPQEYERLLQEHAALEIPRHEGEPPLLLPCLNTWEDPSRWERIVRLPNGGIGRLTVTVGVLGFGRILVAPGAVSVEIGITDPEDLDYGSELITRRTGPIGRDVRDLLASAREGIDRIPDELWELMAAPIEGD